MSIFHGTSAGTAALLFIAGIAAGAAVSSDATAQTNSRWVTLVIKEEPEVLDGCMAAKTDTGTIVMQNVVETLVNIDDRTGALSPGLATAWNQVNPTTWRFKLREGVKFHDGQPFNAANAAKSINRTMSKELACGSWMTTFGDQKIVAKAADEYTLELSSEQPDPIMPVRAGGLIINSPNTATDKLVNNPVGTGPYVFEKWQPGQEITIKRNENYWGKKPVVEGARYIWRNDSSVRATMVKIGEADLAPELAAQDAKEPELDASYPTAEATYFRIDTLKAPLNDVRVRLALNYAFDRYTVLGSILPKDFQHATQLVLPSTAGHNHELDKMVRAYDPVKAKQLLAQAKAAGTPIDTEIVLTGRATVFANATEVMEAALTMYRAVGLNMKIAIVNSGQSRLISNQPFAEDRPSRLLAGSHDNKKGDPVFSVFFKYGCKGIQSALCVPELDKAIDDATATAVGQARVEKWQNVFKVLYEDLVPEVWLYYTVGYARISKRIDFRPSVTTSGAIPLATIGFK